MRALSKKGVKIHIFPAARPLLYKVREIKTHKTDLTHACTQKVLQILPRLPPSSETLPKRSHTNE